MSLVEGITQEVERHQVEMRRLVSAFREKIMALPDNPRIKRMPGRGFVVRSSDVMNNLSVKHHDFKAQYRHLAAMIEGSPERAVQIVKEAAERESIRVGSSDGKFTITLHPDVVVHLKDLIDDCEL